MPKIMDSFKRAYSILQKTGEVERQGISNVIGGIKALANPSTRGDYLTGAKQTLQDRGILNPPIKARSNVPPAIKQTFKKATEGFTPLAAQRAENIKIKYTPYVGQNGKMFMKDLFGVLAPGSAGHYTGLTNTAPNGEIVIGSDYAKDPEILRHELIHSMDTNVNFVGRSKLPWRVNGVEIPEEAHDKSAAANEQFADSFPLAIKYLSGLGLLDSRGFYPAVNAPSRGYINERTNNPLYKYGDEPVPSQTRDLEGMAYMGTTGEEYSLPQYRSAIQEAIRAANYPPNTGFARQSMFVQPNLRPQNHIPGMD